MNLDDPKLTAFALDELEGEEAAQIKELVESDSNARIAVEEIRQVARMVSRELERETAPGLTAKERKKILDAVQKRPSFWEWFSLKKGIYFLAAAVVPGLVLIIIATQDIYPPPSQSPSQSQSQSPSPGQQASQPSPESASLQKSPAKARQGEPVALQTLGVLASLSAVPSNKNADSKLPNAFNINKSASGIAGPTTSGVVNDLKVAGGRLPPSGGMGNVKTKGLGYGTGTGYGTQGLSGNAGVRGVPGSLIGTPHLVKLSAEEGLSRDQVMEVVKKFAGEIQQCYEQALLFNSNLSGRVEYEWEIRPSGSVNWAKIKKSEVSGGDALNSCVISVFKKMQFPASQNGKSTTPNIGFPFGKM